MNGALHSANRGQMSRPKPRATAATAARVRARKREMEPLGGGANPSNRRSAGGGAARASEESGDDERDAEETAEPTPDAARFHAPSGQQPARPQMAPLRNKKAGVPTLVTRCFGEGSSLPESMRCRRSRAGSTATSSVRGHQRVEQFEVKCETTEKGRPVVYSPMYLWTAKARKVSCRPDPARPGAA